MNYQQNSYSIDFLVSAFYFSGYSIIIISLYFFFLHGHCSRTKLKGSLFNDLQHRSSLSPTVATFYIPTVMMLIGFRI